MIKVIKIVKKSGKIQLLIKNVWEILGINLDVCFEKDIG